MRVFILCTGRCGSVTFSQACRHFTNFKSLHEPFAGRLGSSRAELPDQTIYVDNRLCWLTGHLSNWFTSRDVALWLRRNPDDVANSFNRRWGRGGIMHAYASGILMGAPRGIETARDLVATMEANITMFLDSLAPEQQRIFDLEQARACWPHFCDWIGAKGNLKTGLKEFERRYNATK